MLKNILRKLGINDRADLDFFIAMTITFVLAPLSVLLVAIFTRN